MKLLTRPEAEAIHQASLDLLENPGCRLEHETIRRRLVKAGALETGHPEVLRFPRRMVAELLALAPREVRLDGRGDAAGHTLTPVSPPIVWSVPGMNILEQGVHRPFTSRDMGRMAALFDRLDQIDGVFGMSMEDIEPRFRDIAGLVAMAENTRKHLRVLCFSVRGGEILKSVRDFFPGNWFSVGFTAHGPLRWTNLALSIYEATAGRGIPATVNGEPMAGVSGPVTLAGAAAVGNAEILAGIMANQVLEPGRPCIYNLGLAHIFDMRSAIAVTGGPENHLLAGISAEMGRFYNLPSCSWVSTESMLPDQQAAMEKSLGFASHIDAGVSLIWAAGQLESELTLSPAQAVIDNEIIGYVRRLNRGVEVNRDTLALDLIREVGISGSFLETDHTFENFRSELWEPRLSCRIKRQNWREAGGLDLGQAAEREAAARIAAHPGYRDECAGLRREIEQAMGK